MRAFLLASLVALAACGGAREVQLTIEVSDAITSEQLAAVRTLEIAVLGEGPFSQRYDVGRTLSDRRTTWLYRSKIEGPLKFQVVARGDARRLIASGTSPVVSTGGSAAEATVTLGLEGQPNKFRLGQTCTPGVDVCASGFCVDGVCCESACEGECNRCNGAVPGTCAPAAAGTNPRNLCKADTQSPCGLDGTCDGAGACRLSPKGKVCAQPTCTQGMLTNAATCDGAGACGAPTTRACAPYACNAQGNGCASICTPASGCAPAVSCVSGSCGKVGQGGRCFAGTDCTNGRCIDGFCCDTTCEGACRSCKEPGLEGTCTTTVAGAMDPHGVCMDQGAASCATNGRCDGAMGCERYAAGTICGAGGCSADGTIFVAGRVCAGDGSACPAEAPQPCGAFRCITDDGPGCAADCGACTFSEAGMAPPFQARCADGRSCADRCLSSEARFVCE